MAAALEVLKTRDIWTSGTYLLRQWDYLNKGTVTHDKTAEDVTVEMAAIHSLGVLKTTYGSMTDEAAIVFVANQIRECIKAYAADYPCYDIAFTKQALRAAMPGVEELLARPKPGTQKNKPGTQKKWTADSPCIKCRCVACEPSAKASEVA
jgi:hypothetical protein